MYRSFFRELFYLLLLEVRYLWKGVGYDPPRGYVKHHTSKVKFRYIPLVFMWYGY